MRRKLGGLLALVVAAGAVLVDGTGASASITGGVGVPTEVISGQSRLTTDVARMVRGTGAAAEQQGLARYWSPARMRAALPDSQLPAMKQAIAHANAHWGLPKPPAKPDGPAVKIAPAKAGTPPPSAIPQSYDPNYLIGHSVARTYGKVFATSRGVNYRCSATVVNTEGKSAVWTAGHCVSEGGTWSSNWVFVPNYINGSAPYGYWSSARLWTTTAWFNNNDFANDMGVSILYRNAGWRIADRLSGQGFAWNLSPAYYAYAFGYPEKPPSTGAYLVGANSYTYDGGGSTIYMVNNMTGGSSGGAWLYGFDGNWGYINGHNDFHPRHDSNHMYSPYFGNNAGNLYNKVRYISA